MSKPTPTCPDCGCADLLTLRVRSQRGGKRVRYRCEHCGREFWVKQETEKESRYGGN